MSEAENQQQLTAEQIAELKRNTLQFYKERIQFMKIQAEFEKLSAEIEEYKLRSLIAQIKMAQIINLMQSVTKNNKKKFLSILVSMINNEYKSTVFDKSVVLIFSVLSEVKTIAKNKTNKVHSEAYLKHRVS